MSQKHWRIGKGVRTAILQLLSPKATILELGSGEGTKWLTERYEVWSVEHDEMWLNVCEKSNYIHAPLVTLEDQTTVWYNPTVLEENLPREYDLILIDGPPGKYGREGILDNLHLLRTDVPIVIDDTIRADEANLSRELAFKLMRPMYVFWNFSIIPTSPLSEIQVSKIQFAAMDVLEKEEPTYLKRYFKSPTTQITPDSEHWVKIWKENQRSERKLKQVMNSWSYRIGRAVTLPLRVPIDFLRRR
jgi:hypothetical protein